MRGLSVRHLEKARAWLLSAVLLVAFTHKSAHASDEEGASLAQGSEPLHAEGKELQETESALWGGGGIGFHASVPNAELSKTAGPMGVGLQSFFGFGFTKVPLLLGMGLGGDFFLPVERSFTYESDDAVWKIKRRSIWMGPGLRLAPRKGKIRPYLQAVAGVWIHDVRIEMREEYEDDQSHNLGMDATGMYGYGAGLDLSWGRMRSHLGLYFHHRSPRELFQVHGDRIAHGA